MKRLKIAMHAFWVVLTGERCVFHSDELEYFHGNRMDKDVCIKLLEEGFHGIDHRASRIIYWRTKAIKK